MNPLVNVIPKGVLSPTRKNNWLQGMDFLIESTKISIILHRAIHH